VRPHALPEGSPLESGTPVKNSSTAGFGRLDVGPGDMLWVGGLPPVSTPGPPLLKTKSMGLAGCLQRVVLDGHVIGLWNFASQGVAGCAACIQRSAPANVFVALNFYKSTPYRILFHICIYIAYLFYICFFLLFYTYILYIAFV
jgi:hypothetical protein